MGFTEDSTDQGRLATSTRASEHRERTSLLPSISTPKGGGALQGIGEKFAANPVMGSASFTVPLGLSPGRSEFGPELELSYAPGNGMGAFGMGWTLSLPRVSRKTDKGLPRYRDTEESDVFLLSGAEDLVPDPAGTGSFEVDGVQYQIRRYRPRIEGLFARIESWTEEHTGDVHWRSISRDNVTSIYGSDDSCRIFHVENPSEPHRRRIFEWLLCLSFDDKGNVVVYDYASENDLNVNRIQPCERNRNRTANRYLKSVRYGNRQSRLTLPSLSPREWRARDDWYFQVLFDYDEDHYKELPLDPSLSEDAQHRFVQACDRSTGNWSVRPDPFSTYRPRFEVRTYRRCRRVLMFHAFAELGTESCLVRSTEFEYADTPEDGASSHGTSFIQRIIRSCYVRQPARPVEETNGLRYTTYLKRSFPPLEFEYTKPRIDETVRSLSQDTEENLPVGVDGNAYQWVDLDGEGLSGILERRSGAWHYKANCGNGRFAPARRLPLQPVGLARAVGAERLVDLSGNGRLDVAVFEGKTPGFFQRTLDSDWEPYRHFQRLPQVSWDDPNLRLLDLTGDGHADLLITGDEVFTFYPSLKVKGFGQAEQVRKPWDEDRGPRLVFSEGEQSIYLADMSGDGLTDLVRIRNGEIYYWPNLGYGRFGAPVIMNNVPRFASVDHFHRSRVLLADIDGSGTTDLIYADSQSIRIFFNLAGNGFGPARTLHNRFEVDEISTLTTTDLLGNGTACLVWSSSLPSQARSPLRFIDLMGGNKPHLLIKQINHLGAETHITYAPSTKFYLQDKRNGKPWITRIPFPVHVVERVEVHDQVSRNLFVTRYDYHHGYFDGEEREFRGFGLVEQYDTEEFSTLNDRSEFPQASNVEESSHIPPVLTKSWFHTGVWLERTRISRFFAGRDGTPGEYFREPQRSDDEAIELLLADTVLPHGLTLKEEREASRALKHSLLRQEIYSLDGSDRQHLPYVVTENSFRVRVLQRKGSQRHGVFLVHEGEALTFNYERSLVPVIAGQIVNEATAITDARTTWLLDPRVAHSITLEVDSFGQELKKVAITYGRRYVDPTLSDHVRQEQALSRIVFSDHRITNAVDTPLTWRVPVPYQTSSYELTGFVPSGPSGRFEAEDFVAPTEGAPEELLLLFDSELDHHLSPTGGRQRRLLEQVRVRFRRDDLSAALPLGQIESRALPFESYKLALTENLVEATYNSDGIQRLSEAPSLGLPSMSEGRYVHGEDEAGAPDHHWWIPSGRIFYSPRSLDTAAEELAFAERHFFLPHRSRDQFHSASQSTESFIQYDDYDLLVLETRDAFSRSTESNVDRSSNRTTVGLRSLDPTEPLLENGYDYRVLQPRLVMDPNRNRTALAYDALGLLCAMAKMGKPEDMPALGDSLDPGFNTDPTRAELQSFFLAPTDPRVLALLGRATVRMIHDLHAQQQGAAAGRNSPNFMATLARESHVHEITDPAQTAIQIKFTYSDGLGQIIQEKAQTEPGPVPRRDAAGGLLLDENGRPLSTADRGDPRWQASGWVVKNNKDKPVRQFEPFFTDRHAFEFDARIGTSPVLFYDPLSRVIATLHPNRTWAKTVLSPWGQAVWDLGDTVAIPRPDADPDVGDFFRRLPTADYQPTWHAFRNDPAWASAFALRYPNAEDREKQASAASSSLVYANTPTRLHLNTLGQVTETVEHNRIRRTNPSSTVEEFYSTSARLDVSGRQLEVRDAQQRLIARFIYNLVGERIHQASMEAGRRWTLHDVSGAPLYGWNDRGHRFQEVYDVLRRPTHAYLSENGGPPELIALTEYGETEPSPEANNLRGQIVRQSDQAGIVSNLAFDFKGNPVRSARQVLESTTRDGIVQPAYRTRINWEAPHELKDEVYESRTRFDALNRVIQSILPHRLVGRAPLNVIQPRYDKSGLLSHVDVWLDHSTLPAGLINSSVVPPSPIGISGIDYDAKGQRLRVDYKATDSTLRFSTHHRYDPETLQVIHTFTRRGVAFPGDCDGAADSRGELSPETLRGLPAGAKCGLQNLRYTHDAAGNLTHLRDSSQQSIFFAGARVDPGAEYVHDAASRLVEATGREHLGQVDGAPIPHSYRDQARMGRGSFPHARDGAALGTYLESYFYDEVGNITAMRHRGTNPTHPLQPQWTRAYHYNEPSQLEPSRFSNRLTSTALGSTLAGISVYSTGGDGYDEHGNLARMPHLHEMRWNAWDQLQMTQRQVVTPGDEDEEERHGERTWYVYDASGDRVRKVTESSNGQLKDERLYLGDFEVYEKPSESLLRETVHIMDDTRRLALVETRVRGPSTEGPSTLVRYQLSDHLSSTSLEVDNQARIVSYEEYTPYGSTAYQALRTGIEAPKRYRYTGMERDEESGLSYHSARYYAPWLGRWTSADPIGLEAGPNLYRYVSAAPSQRVDPEGTQDRQQVEVLLNDTVSESASQDDVRVAFAQQGIHYTGRAQWDALRNYWTVNNDQLAPTPEEQAYLRETLIRARRPRLAFADWHNMNDSQRLAVILTMAQQYGVEFAEEFRRNVENGTYINVDIYTNRDQVDYGPTTYSQAGFRFSGEVHMGLQLWVHPSGLEAYRIISSREESEASNSNADGNQDNRVDITAHIRIQPDRQPSNPYGVGLNRRRQDRHRPTLDPDNQLVLPPPDPSLPYSLNPHSRSWLPIPDVRLHR